MYRKYILNILIVSLLTLNIHGQVGNFELKDLDNQWLSFEEVAGEKLTIIDFWATWCQPCLRSLPEITTLYQDFKEQGVNVVGISIDGPRNQSKLKPFVQSMGVEYTVLRDINSDVMSELGVTAVPTLLIVNSKGEILYQHEGYRPGDGEYLRKKIESFL